MSFRSNLWPFILINKVTGVLLFLLPLTFSFIELKYSATVVCVIATFAAVHEGYLIRNMRVESKTI